LTALLERCRNGAFDNDLPWKYPSSSMYGFNSRYDLLEDQNNSQTPLITHARHRIHLESALQFLEAFLDTRKFFPRLLHDPTRLSTLHSPRGCCSWCRGAAICSTSYWQSFRLNRRGRRARRCFPRFLYRKMISVFPSHNQKAILFEHTHLVKDNDNT